MNINTENKRRSIKTILKELEKEELIEIISEMVKINPKNKLFLDVFLKSSDEINFDEVLKNAKQKIYIFIYGKSVSSKNILKLREAKKIISEHAKMYKEFPELIADLKLYYVETCNDFTNDFGDISEQFYDSVLSNFNDFCNYISKHNNLFVTFKERLDILFSKSRNIGWGYSDMMGDYYHELNKDMEG